LLGSLERDIAAIAFKNSSIEIMKENGKLLIPGVQLAMTLRAILPFTRLLETRVVSSHSKFIAIRF
jgi:hypothetical protein